MYQQVTDCIKAYISSLKRKTNIFESKLSLMYFVLCQHCYFVVFRYLRIRHFCFVMNFIFKFLHTLCLFFILFLRIVPFANYIQHACPEKQMERESTSHAVPAGAHQVLRAIAQERRLLQPTHLLRCAPCRMSGTKRLLFPLLPIASTLQKPR